MTEDELIRAHGGTLSAFDRRMRDCGFAVQWDEPATTVRNPTTTDTIDAPASQSPTLPTVGEPGAIAPRAHIVG